MAEDSETLQTAASCNGRIPRMWILSYPHKLRALHCIRQLSGNVGYCSQDPDRVFRVDLVPGIAWLVIITVQAREEEKRRYLLCGKRSVIAGSISTELRLIGFEPGMLRCMLHDRFEC